MRNDYRLEDIQKEDIVILKFTDGTDSNTHISDSLLSLENKPLKVRKVTEERVIIQDGTRIVSIGVGSVVRVVRGNRDIKGSNRTRKTKEDAA